MPAAPIAHLQQLFELQVPEAELMLAAGLDFGKTPQKPALLSTRSVAVLCHNASDTTAGQSSHAKISDLPDRQVDTWVVPNTVHRQHSLSKKVKTPMLCAHSGKPLLLLGANHVLIGLDFQAGYVPGQHKVTAPVELRAALFSW